MESRYNQFSKKVTLQRGPNGFGFTLRHFLVYPNQSVEKNCRGEPLETTFVQTVNKGSSAHKFGLQEGDRILSVNGESVSGKSYKDIVHLVKESPDQVDLLLVSRKDDILQMAFAASSFQAQPGKNWSKSESKSRRREQYPEQKLYQEPPDYKQHQQKQRRIFSANNNNSNQIEFAKFQQNYYDTLDSAYSTGESSYNTVDSTYTQRLTPDYENDQDYSRPVKTTKPLPVYHPFITRSAFRAVAPATDRLKYADDVNDSDSDTATETETDTTLNFSGCSVEENMSYVPDYVRPVLSSPVSVSAVTSPTASFTTSRPVHTLTLTSPSTSVTSSNVSSPTASTKDVSYAEQLTSPRGTSLYKRSNHNNSSYTGYREDYIRKQKDKLCGRKSLDERLKSLESGAAVKLKVSKGSQKRRKKSEDRGDASAPSEKSENSTVGDASRLDNPSAQVTVAKDAQVDAQPTKAPPPDIIESHQPKAVICDKDAEIIPGEADRHSKLIDSYTRLQMPVAATENNEAQVNPFEDDNNAGGPSAPSNLEPVAVTWNLSPPSVRRKVSLGNEDSLSSGANMQQAREDLPPPPEVKADVPVAQLSAPVATRKLEWKKPSPETLTKMQESKPIDKVPPPITVPEELIQPELVEPETSKPSEDPVPESPKLEVKVQLRSPTRNAPLQRRGPPPLILDVTTDTAVVPVELRSPRGEGGALPRGNMREKRNARVFVLPSSDDSESDNLTTKMNKPVDHRHVHIAPVKFVPSVLRRRSRDRTRDEVSSSASSSVTDVNSSKETSETNTAKPSSHRKETSKRKSSQSPKRTSSKHAHSRSKSSHDRPPLPHHTHSRQKSAEGNLSSTGSKDKKGNMKGVQSPDLRHRTTHQKSEARTPNSPRTKSKFNDEYAELSNKRRTPKSSRKFQEATSLPSPRQQAVAHAVKFGFPGTEGSIPYIDEASPDESKSDQFRSLMAESNADPEVIRKALPLSSGSRRGRTRRRRSRSPNRRTSYMEAMGSDEDLTPDPDTEGSTYSLVRTSSGKDHVLSKFGRSNSADSILSTIDPVQKVILRKQKRSNSADRNTVKAVHRRSYQIATSPNGAATDTDLLRTPVHKRQPSIRKLKNFFGESAEKTPQIVEAQADEGRRGSRSRSLQPVPTLDLSDYDDTVAREGFLCFKVATIDKGKRSSSQKLWKVVWVVLKEQTLYLCRDWSRHKQEGPGSTQNGSVHNNSGSQPPSQLLLEEEEPLNIQGSLVSIAYNYVKRKNVFKVTTGNGSEYLFQAEDRDDMLAWINSIQVIGNHDNEDGEVIINEDLILRKTNQIESGPKPEKKAGRKSRSPKTIRRAQVPIKDVDGSRRFKWRGSVNRIVRKFGQGQTLMQGQTFDVHLEDCPPSLTNECVPYVVELCCRLVEQRGLSFTGIYRVPGNSGTLANLQEELNLKGPDSVDPETDERFQELNVVSSLLKSFFRKLPDPLFTNELYDDFITMNRKKDSEERLNGLRRLIHMLPAPHYETLKFLIGHLRKVADNADENKMEVRNLAIVFGPTLVRSTISDNMATMVTDMSDQCRIVESVLQHAEWFFAEAKEEGEVVEIPVPPPPKDEPREPVPNIDHLLANVGRTPGDESDSTSESSKSKNSMASEKESFSRDVMDMFQGVRKRWLQNQVGAGGGRKEGGGSESEDEFGFKEAEAKRQSEASLRPNHKEENVFLQTSNAPSGYQVSKAAAADIRAARGGIKDHHQHLHAQPQPHLLPHDIPSRLYDFYVEHLDRLGRSEVARHPIQFTSSSETSPQVTPRHSFFAATQPTAVAPAVNRASKARRSSDQKPRPYASPPSSPPHNAPLLYGDSPLNRRYTKQPETSDFRAVLATSTPVHANASLKGKQPPPLPPRSKNDSELSSIAIEHNSGRRRDSESDSDTSVYVGDTLEEKLRNLTNLDKKLERRPSRRYRDADEPEVPSKGGKRLTAPSYRVSDPNSNNNNKKSTREIYQERRAMRQQHRELVKASRGERRRDQSGDVQGSAAMSRCASDENVFNRCDPKRQKVRSPDAVVDGKEQRLPSHERDRVRRRHTLGGNDFPGQDFWEKADSNSQHNGNAEFYGSLQNVSSAASRLYPGGRPRPPPAAKNAAGRRAPPQHWRVDLTSIRAKPLPHAKKSESYI